MPFRSEKQRRYLWATHPDIAKRWAHKYPESNKGLPMYADNDNKEKAEKAAQNDTLLAYVNSRTQNISTAIHIKANEIVKNSEDATYKVKIPHSDKPTYAGQEREEGEQTNEKPEDAQIEKKEPENAINSLLQKIALVLSQPMAQALENRRAVREAREPARQPKNVGIRRYNAPVAAIPPPMGMQPQQATQTTSGTPVQQPGQGMNSPSAQPINSFGPLSSDGNINGNAAFGVKNSPDSLKTASGNNTALAKIMSIDGTPIMDPEELDYEDERMKTAESYDDAQYNKTLMAVPAILAAIGGAESAFNGPKGKKIVSGLRGAAIGGAGGLGAAGAAYAMRNSPPDSVYFKPAVFGSGLAGMTLANTLLPKIEEPPKKQKSKKASAASQFGEKLAVEVIQPFKSHKRQTALPKQIQKSFVNKNEAETIARAMAAAAPHGALDNTRVELYGTQLKDLQERMVDNPRLMPMQKWLNRYEASTTGVPDKSQLLPDAYHPIADNVWLPSGNPAVLMHELGHGIDFNAYPNTTQRALMAGIYTRYAPTLWKEHAAWRKGQKYFLEGAAQHKLPPELVVRTLRDSSRAKRLGLGSYWGAGLGALAGGAGGLALLLNIGESGRRPWTLPLVGAGIGGSLGGLAGLTVGNIAAESDKFNSPEMTQKYLQRYADAYAKTHNVPNDVAHNEIQQLAKKLIAKNKSAKKPLAKAASILN